MDIQEKVARQDMQLESIQKAEEKYKDDTPALIAFWEEIWSNGGLLFKGAKWAFRLPDLYIQTKQYDKALGILAKIEDPTYSVRKESYIQKIEKLKAKKR